MKFWLRARLSCQSRPSREQRTINVLSRRDQVCYTTLGCGRTDYLAGNLSGLNNSVHKKLLSDYALFDYIVRTELTSGGEHLNLAK